MSQETTETKRARSETEVAGLCVNQQWEGRLGGQAGLWGGGGQWGAPGAQGSLPSEWPLFTTARSFTVYRIHLASKSKGNTTTSHTSHKTPYGNTVLPPPNQTGDAAKEKHSTASPETEEATGKPYFQLVNSIQSAHNKILNNGKKFYSYNKYNCYVFFLILQFWNKVESIVSKDRERVIINLHNWQTKKTYKQVPG